MFVFENDFNVSQSIQICDYIERMEINIATIYWPERWLERDQTTKKKKIIELINNTTDEI